MRPKYEGNGAKTGRRLTQLGRWTAWGAGWGAGCLTNPHILRQHHINPQIWMSDCVTRKTFWNVRGAHMVALNNMYLPSCVSHLSTNRDFVVSIITTLAVNHLHSLLSTILKVWNPFLGESWTFAAWHSMHHHSKTTSGKQCQSTRYSMLL